MSTADMIDSPPPDQPNLDVFLSSSEEFGTTNRYPVDSNLTKTLRHSVLAASPGASPCQHERCQLDSQPTKASY